MQIGDIQSFPNFPPLRYIYNFDGELILYTINGVSFVRTFGLFNNQTTYTDIFREPSYEPPAIF